jgi:hypothetical protein
MEIEYLWCIVGNIAERPRLNDADLPLRGTKHFSAKTKVYCLPQYGGMGHEDMPVFGRHRKSKRWVKIVIRTKNITNFRLKKVYKPELIQAVQDCSFYRDLLPSDVPDEVLQSFLASLNKD